MRIIKLCVVIVLLTSSCGQRDEGNETTADTTGISEANEEAASNNEYSNVRFRNVTFKKAGDNRFVVAGQAQIFEANFGWTVEDGHQEINSGYEMTDAGAPRMG